jgi:ribosomal protein S12 methylthiotransferase accessory factor
MSIRLGPCLKGHTLELDKVCPPEQTVSKVRAAFAAFGDEILARTRRIDTGRLGIPVFLSMCGPLARCVMPTRKQMGKGASAIQAEASALVELAERFSLFSFWADTGRFVTATWSQAEQRWPGSVLPISEITKSVGEDLPEEHARAIMNLISWRFGPVTEVRLGKELFAPLDWFKKINEFNGSSAGNTAEESILQGLCELIERHVCAVVDRGRMTTPTIDPGTLNDPVLQDLWEAFARQGVRVLLKDFSLGLPAPTVAAIAYDPATFPDRSEIVFTAGTAATPAKAAIRALTEVAQLAGDFETGSNYEASGLPKFTAPSQLAWLQQGPTVSLESLPSIANRDIFEEIKTLTNSLACMGLHAYSTDTTHPALGVPAHYSFVPGFQFRERALRPSLGLFVGRILAEEYPAAQARTGLHALRRFYPEASYLDFFAGLLAIRLDQHQDALGLLAQSESRLDHHDDRALAAFYQGYALTRAGAWDLSITHLDRAIDLCPELKEYYNLRGVAKFKMKQYASAEHDFQAALNLDSGSAVDLANIGLCAKFLGRGKEAAELLQSALELDPGLDFAKPHLEELLGQSVKFADNPDKR